MLAPRTPGKHPTHRPPALSRCMHSLLPNMPPFLILSQHTTLMRASYPTRGHTGSQKLKQAACPQTAPNFLSACTSIPTSFPFHQTVLAPRQDIPEKRTIDNPPVLALYLLSAQPTPPLLITIICPECLCKTLFWARGCSGLQNSSLQLEWKHCTQPQAIRARRPGRKLKNIHPTKTNSEIKIQIFNYSTAVE